MKINLGCNDKHLDGFVNIDMNPKCEPDLIGDVSDLDSYFERAIASGVTSFCTFKAHFDSEPITEMIAYDIIEHFDRVQIPAVLKNWFDHLAPGGKLFIRTNDLDRMIQLYQSDAQTFPADKFIWHLMCEHETSGMGHKWCFTRRSLFVALLHAGFRKVEITSEDKIKVGDYYHSNTAYDLCNMHMIATKDML
jgi:predicted SAM-dependent methyltransferase